MVFAGRSRTQSTSVRSQALADGLALDLSGILTVFDAVMPETTALTVNTRLFALGSAPKLNVLASGAPRSAILGFASRVARSCFSTHLGQIYLPVADRLITLHLYYQPMVVKGPTL